MNTKIGGMYCKDVNWVEMDHDHIQWQPLIMAIFILPQSYTNLDVMNVVAHTVSFFNQL